MRNPPKRSHVLRIVLVVFAVAFGGPGVIQWRLPMPYAQPLAPPQAPLLDMGAGAPAPQAPPPQGPPMSPEVGAPLASTEQCRNLIRIYPSLSEERRRAYSATMRWCIEHRVR